MRRQEASEFMKLTGKKKKEEEEKTRPPVYPLSRLWGVETQKIQRTDDNHLGGGKGHVAQIRAKISKDSGRKT